MASTLLVDRVGESWCCAVRMAYRAADPRDGGRRGGRVGAPLHAVSQ